MCNAYGHPLGCECGFGGEFYSNSSSFITTPNLGRQYGTFTRFMSSHTTPNYKCRICKALCFFYQSPYGGRVVFDELGYPWKKHECFRKNIEIESANLSTSSISRDWSFLYDVTINKLKKSTNVYQITGTEEGTKVIYYTLYHRDIFAEAIQIEHVHDKITAFILCFDGKDWITMNLVAFINESLARSKQALLGNGCRRIPKKPIPISSQ